MLGAFRLWPWRPPWSMLECPVVFELLASYGEGAAVPRHPGLVKGKMKTPPKTVVPRGLDFFWTPSNLGTHRIYAILTVCLGFDLWVLFLWCFCGVLELFRWFFSLLSGPVSAVRPSTPVRWVMPAAATIADTWRGWRWWIRKAERAVFLFRRETRVAFKEVEFSRQ